MRILIWTARHSCRVLETRDGNPETERVTYAVCGNYHSPLFSQLPSLDTHNASTLVYTSQDRAWSMTDRLVRLGSESGLSLGFGRSTDEIKAFFFVSGFPLPGQLLHLIVVCYHSPVVHNLDLNHFWCRETPY